MIEYHDCEWGVPVHDDRLLFEFLILEGAQAGLSWTTVLKKRLEYRKVFDNFVAEKVARYNKTKVEKLLQNPSELEAWVRTATPGDNAVYYTGMLAVARLTLAHPKRMASAAQAQAEAGTVLLTQRRVSAFSCEYLITRLSIVQPGLGWWAGTSL